ncbi:hypothetical protein [Verrucosispora sp. NA02020]|uniref:hypothetical protein n=1 Tax=Verrucosispora sp. NA02020 TaxID=2742132 RepID=UPI00158FA798|nr:hypothetical protein [Verrucosispora sp. NA02020]QKW15381.1 hypothetical protein HUT12_23185 [Verrucosispora sp. NA02020]
MTAPSVEPSVDHAEAIEAMLRAGTAHEVHMGAPEVPDDELTYPHYIVWPPPATPGLQRLAGDGGDVWTRTQITCVALTPLDVIGAADRARRALHRRRPTIAGRLCGDIEQDPEASVAPPVPDPTPRSTDGRQVYTTALLFLLHSSPLTL